MNIYTLEEITIIGKDMIELLYVGLWTAIGPVSAGERFFMHFARNENRGCLIKRIGKSKGMMLDSAGYQPQNAKRKCAEKPVLFMLSDLF